MPTPRVTQRHGQSAGYNTDGCRCEPCREWGRRSRAAIKADPERRAGDLAAKARWRASEKGKATALRNRHERVKRVRQIIQDAKSAPCHDCGLTYPYYVMDLDHRPGEGKVRNLASWTRSGGSIKSLLAEIAKCDAVCSNCHRERTYSRVVAH